MSVLEKYAVLYDEDSLFLDSREAWLIKLVYIEIRWRAYVSVNYASIGSDNGFSPERHQSIVNSIPGYKL